MAVAQAFREIKREILEGYLNLQGEAFEGFIKNVCVWTLEGDRVKIPLNKENEAITTVTREVVKIERMLHWYQLWGVMTDGVCYRVR